jgi:hypothetical protein
VMHKFEFALDIKPFDFWNHPFVYQH